MPAVREIGITIIDEFPQIRMVVTYGTVVKEDKRWYDVASQGHFETMVTNVVRMAVQDVIRSHKQGEKT